MARRFLERIGPPNEADVDVLAETFGDVHAQGREAGVREAMKAAISAHGGSVKVCADRIVNLLPKATP